MNRADWNGNHGWVLPRPDGLKARCGGPSICSECQQEFTFMAEAAHHLFNWTRFPGDNFHNLLFTLIQKGSGGNRERIGMGFPFELEAWREWQDTPSQDAFFEKYVLAGSGKTRPARTPSSRSTASAAAASVKGAASGL